MNKRIRELASFCIMNSYESRINIEDFERFAHLLIKECCDILDEYHFYDDGKLPHPRVRILNKFEMYDYLVKNDERNN